MRSILRLQVFNLAAILRRAALIILVTIVVLTNSSVVRAFDSFYSNNEIQFIDPTACDPNAAATSAGSSTTPAEGPVYMLGDSITDGAKTELSSEFTKASLSVTKINAGVGRAISRSTVPSQSNTSGIEAIAADQNQITSSKTKTIIVALGTNDGTSSLKKDIKTLTDNIHTIDSSIKIYWVNVFSQGKSPYTVDRNAINTIIKDSAASDGYTVIDTVGANIDVGSDGTHPTATGSKTFAKTVVDGLGASSSSPPGAGATGTTGTGAGGATSAGPTKPGVSFDDTQSTDTGGKTNYDTDGTGPTSTGRGSSSTSLSNHGRGINGDEISYIALNPGWAQTNGIKIGDIAMLTYHGKPPVYAIYGDNHIGPDPHAEISVKADLGLKGSPPADNLYGVHYTIYPGSRSLLGITGSAVSTSGDFDQTKIDKFGPQVSGGQAASSGSSSTNSGGSGTCCPTASGQTSSNTGANPTNPAQVEKAVWDYFIGKGLKPEIVAGIMGNISQESSFNPEEIEKTATTGGNTKDPSTVTVGWGLIQWTPGKGVINEAKKAGATGPIYETNTQLDIIWWEATHTSPPGKSNILPELEKATTPEQATIAWEQLMEAAGMPDMTNRITAAKDAFKKYSATTSSAPGSVANQTLGTCTCTDSNMVFSGTADVVLDAGHSGIDRQGKESDSGPGGTGLLIGDSSNDGERQQVWDVTQKVKTALEAKGYKVALTKQNQDDYVNLKQRAEITNNYHPAIAVSIHTTGGNFGDAAAGWVVPQKVGGYRANPGTKTVFTDTALAQKSLEYSNAIIKARQAVEGGVTIHDLDFTGRAGLSGGNISIVQLFSKVPWVYNEVGQSGFDATKYAEGITKGIEAAVPLPASGVTPSTSGTSPSSPSSIDGCVGGNVAQTAVKYAWPDYHPAPYKDLEPAYKVAVDRAQKNNVYVGSNGTPEAGIDCNGFINVVMRDSGWDPGFEGSGGTVAAAEYPYLKSGGKWKQIPVSTSKDLQPGDVFVEASLGHTLMYVGKQPGFNSIYASASTGGSSNSWRAPMADSNSGLYTTGTWFRKN